jgi:tRNA threonylcarbamoyladenosine biosynthesis protein TsaE
MKLKITSAELMVRFGESLGRQLRGNECIELVGDVGAGKTTLTKGLALGLNISESIQSPSFTISRSYTARDNLQLIHYDFYRLPDPGIMCYELAESLSDKLNVVIIEWANSVKNVLPAKHMTIKIASIPSSNDLDEARAIEISSCYDYINIS